MGGLVTFLVMCCWGELVSGCLVITWRRRMDVKNITMVVHTVVDVNNQSVT